MDVMWIGEWPIGGWVGVLGVLWFGGCGWVSKTRPRWRVVIVFTQFSWVSRTMGPTGLARRRLLGRWVARSRRQS